MVDGKKKHKAGFSSTKEGGYATQKKYRVEHPDRVKAARIKAAQKNYEPKVRIPREYKTAFDALLTQTGLTITELFIGAVEEKYNIILHRDLTNK